MPADQVSLDIKPDSVVVIVLATGMDPRSYFVTRMVFVLARTQLRGRNVINANHFISISLLMAACKLPLLYSVIKM